MIGKQACGVTLCIKSLHLLRRSQTLSVGRAGELSFVRPVVCKRQSAIQLCISPACRTGRCSHSQNQSQGFAGRHWLPAHSNPSLVATHRNKLRCSKHCHTVPGLAARGNHDSGGGTGVSVRDKIKVCHGCEATQKQSEACQVLSSPAVHCSSNNELQRSDFQAHR